MAAPRPRRQAGTPRWRWPRAQSAARPAAPASPAPHARRLAGHFALTSASPALTTGRPYKGDCGQYWIDRLLPRRAPRAAPTPVNFARSGSGNSRGEPEAGPSWPAALRPDHTPVSRAVSAERSLDPRSASCARRPLQVGSCCRGHPLRTRLPPAGRLPVGLRSLGPWVRAAVKLVVGPMAAADAGGTLGRRIRRSRMGGDLQVGRGTRGDKAAKAKLTLTATRAPFDFSGAQGTEPGSLAQDLSPICMHGGLACPKLVCAN